MASDINRVVLVGRLTKDPELKTTNGGTSYANFSLAVNRSQKKGDKYEDVASFINCVAWGKYPGETIANHCKKGQRIGIEGRLQQRSWKDDNGGNHNITEVNVDGFEFLDAKAQQGEGGSSKPEPEDAPPPSAQHYRGDDMPSGGKSHFDDTDIPF